MKKFEGISQGVPSTELFTDAFMQRYTDFATLQDMVNVCGIKEFEKQGDKFLDVLVAHTRFKTWDEMLIRAGLDRIKGDFRK